MIGFLKGENGGLIDGKLLLKLAGGIGYLINIGQGLDYKKTGNTVELYIYESRKEDRLDFYGFTTIKEREWVDKLLKVNGVGPKMAAQIIFQLGEDKIFNAINNKDVEVLKTVKGLGVKTIKKIILELSSQLSVDEMDNMNTEKSQTVSDFTETLSSLGYSRGLIVGAITAMKKDKVWNEQNLKEMVRVGLKYLAKK